MKRFYLSKLIALIILFSGLFALQSDAQCNCSWQYKVPLTVTNLGGTAQTDYQVSVIVNTQALISAGKMLANGNDIRFSDNSGSCINLPYWIESGINTATTKIWIKVASIPASASTTVNMYYGNPAATAASDGDATFVFFDNFPGSTLNTSKWNTPVIGGNGGTYTVGGNQIALVANSSCAWVQVDAVNSFPSPYYSEMNVITATGNWPAIVQADNSSYSNNVYMNTGGTTLYAGNSSSSPWGSSLTTINSSFTAPAGIWSIVRTSSNTLMSYPPSGTYTYTGGGATTSFTTQNTAFGTLDCGGSSLTISWFRVRKYYAAGTSLVVGSESVNGAQAIGGTPTVCSGATTALTDATPAGTWSSGNPIVASVSGTGLVSGLTAGTATITYTAGACTPALLTVTVNPSPSAISGTTSVCTGLTTPLSSSPSGGTWTTGSSSQATVTSLGVVSGVSPGTPSVTYTMPGGCFASTTVTVNQNPAAITGTTLICGTGQSTTLNEITSGGTWASSSIPIASVSGLLGTSATIMGGTPGSAVISYSMSTGCFASTVVTVNNLAQFTVTGGGQFCAGSTSPVHIGLNGSSTGVNYQLYNGGISASPLVAGTGSPLDFGIESSSGTYTVKATNAATGCNTLMTGSVSITINAAPGAFTVQVPGGINTFCAGPASIHVQLSGSESGVNYKLFRGITPLTTMSGSGGLLDFGAEPAGTYTIIAENATTHCTNNMTGSVTIISNPLPLIYPVTGGGSYCSGGTGVHIGLSYSDVGVNYTLYNGVTAMPPAIGGSNSGLDFGAVTGIGTYTVKGVNAITGCTSTMTGSVTVSVNPLPGSHEVIADNSGIYCAGGTGVHVRLDGSTTGVSYQLLNSGAATGSAISGTGTGLDFGVFTTGTYTVEATNSVTGCVSEMDGSAIIGTAPLPFVYPLMVSTGGTVGHFCSGGDGVDILLPGSDYNISYQLYRGLTPVGAALSGTGGTLDFLTWTTPGSYSVIATDQTYSCTNSMGSVTVIADPLPSVFTVTGGGGYCQGGAGVHVGLGYSEAGVSYQLWLNGGTLVGTLSGTGTGLDFGIQIIAGSYTVSATNISTGCNNAMDGFAVVTVNQLPDSLYMVSPSSGSFCAGTGGIDITTNGSDEGINYQLYRGLVAVGPAIGGTGGGEGDPGALDFGYQSIGGVYKVVATNSISGCSSTLSGTTTITVKPLPNVYIVGGGGNYCADGTGVHITMSGSDTSISYQLYNGVNPAADPFVTLGGPLDFGIFTDAGTYTVIATNISSGCTKGMSGSATIGTLPLPLVFTITGGGNYCTGGTGVHVGLDSSEAAPNIHYQLYADGVATGPALTGTGSALDFGLKTATGNYTVKAMNIITGCTSLMSSVTSVNTLSLPIPHTVGGGGVYCAGGDGVAVNLGSSDENVSYQLYRGGVAVGGSVSGGGTLDFGMQTIAGVYTVVGTDNGTHCSSNMTGSAVVGINTPVIYTVIGGGSYCEGGLGEHVGLSGSHTGVRYQLYYGISSLGDPVPGTGSALDFGLLTSPGVYTVISTDTTYSCQGNMTGSATINVNVLPNIHTVTGGGRFCAGGAGVPVGLDGTDETVKYQLYNGITASGIALTGGGGSIDFGLETSPGTYTVVATNPSTGCMNTMSESAAVTVIPLPVPYPVMADNFGNFCASDSGLHVRLPNSDAGVKYQLYRDGIPVGGLVTGTGTSLDLGLQIIAGSYSVFASDSSSTCTNNMAGSAHIYIIPLPIVYNVTGGGSYCPGTAGVAVGLEHSQMGIYYQLYKGITPIGSPMYGTGVSLDFGIQPAGTYTIVGNSAITTCPNDMFGTAVISQDTLPLPTISIKAYPGLGVGVWHIDSLQVLFANGGANPSFQWVINGNTIAGATSSTFSHHEFFNGDSITVMVTADGPCGGLTARKGLLLHLFDVGVHQVTGAGSDVKLIPNPNKGAFSVKGTLGSTTDEEVSLEVTNMVGQTVYSNKVIARSGLIDEHIQLGDVANGMYIMNVRSASQNNVIHFVVEQ